MPTGTARAVSARRAVAFVACGLLIAAGGLLFSARAYAAFTPAVPTGNGILQIDSDPYPAQLQAIAPGESAQLQLHVRLEGAPSGSLAMQLRGSGPLVERAAGLKIAVASCPRAFEGQAPHLSCAVGGESILAAAPLASVATSTSSSSWLLEDIRREQARFLLVTLSMPPDTGASDSIVGLAGNFAVGLYAAGDDVAAPAAQRSVLADTGLSLAGPLLIALGTLGIGLVMRRMRREHVPHADAKAGVAE
jgi:hypothetical protein